jgi:hypothetical protein
MSRNWFAETTGRSLPKARRRSVPRRRRDYQPRVELLELRALPSGFTNFNLPIDYFDGVNTSPHGIAAADFNNDGHTDVVIDNPGLGGTIGFNNTVTVYLNSGNGQLGLGTNFTVGSQPNDVRAADLNGDGNMDIITANSASSTVSILLGNGDGTFKAAMNFAAGTGANRATVADFNGDGKPDLAVADNSGGSVSILLGNGNGTFGAATSFSTGASTFDVKSGDFNGDGKLDLVVSNGGVGGVGNGYSFLQGNGNGTFKSPVHTNYAANPTPDVIAVGDFNHDTKLDMAIANDTAGSVAVLLGNGNGTFAAPVNYAAGASTAHDPTVVAGDLNGDGNLDLVVTDHDASHADVLLGNADGTFAPSVSYITGTATSSLTVGDLNGDGHLDIVTANNGGDQVTELLNLGNGTFTTGPTTLAAGTAPSQVVKGDFNGDGKTDLAMAFFGPTAGAAGGGVDIFLGNGDGTFQAATSLVGDLNPNSVAVADFNGDGKQDLVCANLNGSDVSVFLGNGNGTFGAAVNFKTDAGPNFVLVGAAGAGKPIAIATTNQVNNDVSILLGNGNGTFKAAINVALPTGSVPVSFGGSDFNGDGNVDLVTSDNALNQLTVLLGNGNGTFKAPLNLATSTGTQVVIVGDFNGDKAADIAVADFGDINTNAGSMVQVFLGNGNGTFKAAANYNVGRTPVGLTAVNLNNRTFNGLPVLDLVATNFNGNDISVLLNNGDGTGFGAATSYVVTDGSGGITGGAISVAGGDFNGDKTSDLAVANNVTNTVSILLNDPAKLVVSAASTEHVNVAFTVTVSAEDQFGNIVTNYLGTVHFSNTGASATLPPNEKFNPADAGVDTVSVTYTATGSGTLTATDTVNNGITGSETFSIVSPAAFPAKREDQSGDLSTALAPEVVDNFFIHQAFQPTGVYVGGQ